MDRESWFIDFAKIAGRKNLHKYAIGVFKNILVSNNNAEQTVEEVRNALESLDKAFCDESLPWDVADIRKASAPTEALKKIS